MSSRPLACFRSHWPEILACLGFLASRGAIWIWSGKYLEDVEHVYSKWALEFRQARDEGKSLYLFHEEIAQQRLRARKDSGRGGGNEHQAIEYPPLALDVLLFPTIFLGPVPESAPDKDGWQRRYAHLYRLQMVVYDSGTFALLLWLSCFLFQGETWFRRLERYFVYGLGSSALGFVLYNRMDICLAFLILLASAFLILRVHYLWSFLVLVLGIHFKLIPLILLPIWVLGSLPAQGSRASLGERKRPWLPLGQRSAVALALVVGLIIPYILAAGGRTLSFLGYHRDRGIEIESVYANLLMIGALAGEPFEVYESHGSYNARGTGSEMLIRVAPIVLALWFGILSFLLLRKVFQVGLISEERLDETMAQAHPHFFLHAAFLFLLISVAANKVFSPQYLLWVLPLGVLVDCRGRERTFFIAALLGMCLLTGLIYPFLFWKDIAGLTITPEGQEVYHGFSLRGFWVLTVRNLLSLGMAFYLSVQFSRKKVHAPSPISDGPGHEGSPPN